MEIKQEQYDMLKEVIEKAQKVLNEIKGIEKEGDENKAYWSRRMGVLATVMLEGGVVTGERWVEIGKERGYDPRGTAGFYAGEKSTMTVIGGDKRAITDYGMNDVKDWLNGKWGAKPFDKDLEKFKSLIENKI